MSGRNVPAGWAAFRALRQTPAPHRPKRHGNWKHGARSRLGMEEWRELRVMLRILDAPRVGAGLRVPGVLEWLFKPRPAGWGGHRLSRPDPVDHARGYAVLAAPDADAGGLQ